MSKMFSLNKFLVFLLSIAIVAGCKEVYEPKIDSPVTGYLVVDGFINSGGGTTSITLTRTTKLTDTISVLYEHNAQVQIESDNNEAYPLTEGVNGIYTSVVLNLNASAKYRLKINTQDGKEYVSSYTEVKYTPAIDSVSWQKENGGIQTYINAHDAPTSSKYYQWKYEETWEIHSSYNTNLLYTTNPQTGLVNGVDYRYPNHEADLSLYYCWQSFKSRFIILGTTEKLTSNIIYLPLTYVEPASIKLSVLYSVELKQYSLSKPAYDFYQQLKKNTEQLGSIFDAQPSELRGNIECTTNSSEIVIGYVDVTQEQTKRIFIQHRQVEPWYYSAGCQDILIQNNVDSILKYGLNKIPTFPNTTARGFIIDFYAGDPECVDCTLRGSNVKPSFWP